MRINTIKKNYGNTSQILRYNHSITIEPPRCQTHQIISCMICWPRLGGQVKNSSLQRTKTMISDYTLANEFDLFCTFTINPVKFDSFNIELCKKKMTNWLNNQRKLNPDLIYLGVAEKHKSGRIHFHFLFKHYSGTLVDSHRMEKGRIIYNLQNWRYGFSTATRIESLDKTSSYIKKYITKEMIIESNKKRYFASKNLKKPTKEYNIDFRKEVELRPLFLISRKVLEDFKIYKILN